MSKTLSANMQTHLAGDHITLATCWKITKPDTTVIGFTDHDTDLVVDSVTYSAASGFSPTSIASRNNLAVDNMDLIGLLNSNAITDSDLLAGDYDFSTVDIFLVNYNAIADGTIIMGKGKLGQVSLDKNQYKAEYRSLAQLLQQNIGETYSRLCRADLGDSRCQVNLTSFTSTGAIIGVTSNRIFTTDITGLGDDFFKYGLLSMTSGNNNGRDMEVKQYVSVTGQFELVQSFPEDLAVSDTISVYRGCDKLLSTCISVFNNVDNFRGEPYVPGQKAMTYQR